MERESFFYQKNKISFQNKIYIRYIFVVFDMTKNKVFYFTVQKQNYIIFIKQKILAILAWFINFLKNNFQKISSFFL